MYSNFMVPDNTDQYYDLMKQSYDEAGEVQQDFWKWMMTSLMPIVSKTWFDRLRGDKSPAVNAEMGWPEPERLDHYLTCSDFAYVPMVVKICGENYLKGGDDKRKRGRMKGQSGMMSKENIAQYVESMIKMRSVMFDPSNKNNIEEWGDAIFSHIESLETDAKLRRRAALFASEEADREVHEQDFRWSRKADIVISV